MMHLIQHSACRVFTTRVRLICVLACSLTAALAPFSAARAEEKIGEKIYQQKCALCHGVNGEGNDDHYGSPLIGDRSLQELTELIVDTMPEEDPDECVGEEAEQVARYVYDAFYSEIAQARNRPAEIEFSRLTVRQYEHAVSDLLGSFTGSGNWADNEGLKAEYFRTRRFRGNERLVERVDPQIDFDFGEGVPIELPAPEEEAQEADASADKEKQDEEAKKKKDEEDKSRFNPEEFSIRWQGSVMAPETGDYEFILEVGNGARLWVNDGNTPLIDAWVKSGDHSEYRETIRLLGGRPYFIRVDFFKFKDKSASIRLKWKPPHHAEEVIPARYLATSRMPEQFVITTPFPPDDRSTGFERGSSISKQWQQATTYAAIETAGYVAAHIDQLAKTKSDAEDRGEKIRNFCRQFAERAFRRPLSDEQKALYIDRQFDDSEHLETAVRRTVMLVLKSPRFLYREAGFGQFDDYDVAAWLAFTLWDSLPDQQLREAAAKGQLRTRDQIAGQARRMVNDLRTQAKMREFLHQWLQIDRFHDIAKDPEKYPGFDERIVSDLRTSLDLFLDDILESKSADFRRTLLEESIYLNGRLAPLYGADLPDDADFQKVVLDTQDRAGILSHPYLMTGFAYDSTSSPIHRGVFLSRSVLGRFLKPPPEAVPPLAPELHAELTTRERVALQTSPKVCQTCHVMINELGFSLEHFDAIGRYREQEKDRPIDASGSYLSRSGERVEFTGTRELAEFLADHNEPQRAFAEQLFQYTVKQPVRAFGDDRLDHLHEAFRESDFNIHRLLVEIATQSAMKARELEQKVADN
ncbi:PA14 domain protein [Maioricimonas rarisocia]|uniref:PA14 domain protein n=1 Tax=Maioricimonas rarisocia TaxID=2528026 RepID=A0A517ZC59_9PLAN|nr:DUF1592 domain-containing protein [Maioricimonas rarisocia]QDU40035.1 PA14 domain protein [Maioricimonas rarisocia]